MRWLWNWFTSWFTKQDDLAIYSPKERLIYQYFDGAKLVRADPQVLYRNLMEVGPELSADISVANSPSKDWKKATANAVGKVRTIFNLKHFDEGGLGELELFELLHHFYTYCEAVKKAPSPSRISSASTGAVTPSTEAKDPIILPSSASGLIEKGVCTAAPEPLPTEPVLHSG